MFAVKLDRELIWLSLAAIPATSHVNWDLMTDSCILLFLEQLVYKAGCFESFNQWKEWGNRIFTFRPCSRVIFSFPTPFFFYPSQDFKLIGLSWSSKYEEGGGGRWIGSWADCIHSNLFWWSLSYWLGKAVPVTNSIEGWSFSLILVEGRLIKHANWNKPYMIKPTPHDWLSKNA